MLRPIYPREVTPGHAKAKTETSASSHGTHLRVRCTCGEVVEGSGPSLLAAEVEVQTLWDLHLRGIGQTAENSP